MASDRTRHLLYVACAAWALGAAVEAAPAHHRARTATHHHHTGATRTRTRAQLRALHAQIAAVRREVGAQSAERDRISANLRDVEMSAGRARGELGRIDQALEARTRQRAALQNDRQRELQALADGRRRLAQTARLVYLSGPNAPLKLLLDPGDALQSQRLVAYYGYLGRERADLIARDQQHLVRIDELDRALQNQQTELGLLHGQRSTQLAQLEQSRNERQKILQSVSLEIQNKQDSLGKLQTQQSALEALLTRLARQPPPRAPARPPEKPPAVSVPGPASVPASVPASITSAPVVAPVVTGQGSYGEGDFGRLRGTLVWPTAGRVLARYGQPRATGVRWDGVVIAAARGAPVRAVARGRVVYADWLPGLGLLVIVDHGDGYLSLYGHNEQLLKAAGDPVRAGEVIAAAGDSGGRPEPELYFEIRRAGHPLDPAPWFRERLSGP